MGYSGEVMKKLFVRMRRAALSVLLAAAVLSAAAGMQADGGGEDDAGRWELRSGVLCGDVSGRRGGGRN